MSDNDYVKLVRPGVPGKPVFFAFHGTGGDEHQFFDFVGKLLPEATIVSPRGDVSEHGAARFFRRTGEGVYDMEDLARATLKMAAFVERLKAEHGGGEVIGLGYSNGANILANVLFEKGVFDVAMLLHPLIPFEPKPADHLAGRRVLITAGERDPICPAPLTRSLADYFKEQKADLTLSWHPGGHELRQTEIDDVQGMLNAYR